MDDVDWDVLAILMDPDRIIDRVHAYRPSLLRFLGLEPGGFPPLGYGVDD